MRLGCGLGLAVVALAAEAGMGAVGGQPGVEAGLTRDQGVSVVAQPGRVEAAPGGVSDPITLTITNTSKATMPIVVRITGSMGWGTEPNAGREEGVRPAAARTPEITPGGSVMMTMFVYAPGLAGSPADNLVIEARGEGDPTVWGQAAITAARRACVVDWNGFEGVNAQDLGAFLGDYQRQGADFNGVNGTELTDLFEFVEAFMRGC